MTVFYQDSIEKGKNEDYMGKRPNNAALLNGSLSFGEQFSQISFFVS